MANSDSPANALGRASYPPLLVALALSALLAGPLVSDSLYQVDSGELNAVLAEPGVAHPTGYSSYTILGHLFGRSLRAIFGADAAAWPLCGNAFSFAWFLIAAGAMALAFHAAQGRSRVSLLAFVAGMLLWAGNPAVLRLAVSTEVYSMHTGLLALAWLMMAHALVGGVSARGARRWILLFGLLCGIGLTHHLTFLLLGPPALVVTIILARRLVMPLREFALFLLRGALGVLVGLLPILYMPLRSWQNPENNWGRTGDSLEHLLRHIQGAQYHYRLGKDSLAAFLSEVYGEMRMIEAAFVGVALAVGLAVACWVVFVFVRRRQYDESIAAPPAAAAPTILAALLLLHAALAMSLNLIYQIPDISDYFPPIWWDIGFAAALVLSGFSSRGESYAEGEPRRLPPPAILFAFVLVASLCSFGQLEARHVLDMERRGVALVRRAWLDLPDEPSVVIYQSDNVGLLRYWRHNVGEKPGVMPGHFQHFIGNPVDFERRLPHFGMVPILLYDETKYANADEVARHNQNLVETFIENIRERATVPVYQMDRETLELTRLDGGAKMDFVEEWEAAGLVPPGRQLLKRHATAEAFSAMRDEPNPD